MYIWMCVYTHTYIYVHIYIYMNIHVCLHICISIHTCLEFNITMLMERIPGSIEQETKFNEGRLRIRYPFHAAIVTCNYCNNSWTRTPWCEFFSFFFFTAIFFPHSALVTCSYCNKSWTHTAWCTISQKLHLRSLCIVHLVVSWCFKKLLQAPQHAPIHEFIGPKNFLKNRISSIVYIVLSWLSWNFSTIRVQVTVYSTCSSELTFEKFLQAPQHTSLRVAGTNCYGVVLQPQTLGALSVGRCKGN